jgi:hypothetical protein
MEVIANNLEDFLIDNLSYQLKNGASYVLERKAVTFSSSGGNIYESSNGSKIIKFQLAANEFLDPSTFRFQFTLVNKATIAAHRLRPISGPWCFFRRLRVECAGITLEDFEYNRTHELVETLKNENVRRNNNMEGFGYTWDMIDEQWNEANMPGIKGGSSMTVQFKPCCGILNQPKYIYLKAAPLTFEFELVNNATDCIISQTESDFVVGTDTSTDWSIQNPYVKTDLVVLDSGLMNEYNKYLLDSKSIPIAFETYITQSQNVSATSNDIKLNVARALTKLNTAFITFFKSEQGASVSGKEHIFAKKVVNKPAVEFSHPMINAAGELYDKDYELEWQITCGGRTYPTYPCRSIQETYYRLLDCLNLPDVHQHSISVIDFNSYKKNKFIIGMNFQKVKDAGFTGLSTKAGELLNVAVKTTNQTLNNVFDNIYITLKAECILYVSDKGVELHD